jgi:hypothetical protein
LAAIEYVSSPDQGEGYERATCMCLLEIARAGPWQTSQMGAVQTRWNTCRWRTSTRECDSLKKDRHETPQSKVQQQVVKTTPAYTSG